MTNAAVGKGLLFELENICMGGRQIVHDVLKDVLAGYGIRLTPSLFSECCLYPSLRHVMPVLLRVARDRNVSEETLTKAVGGAVKSALIEKAVNPSTTLVDLIGKVQAGGVTVGTLSAVDRETADQVLKRLGLDDAGITLLPCCGEDRKYPSPDAWLKLGRALRVDPSRSVVLASSNVACRAAMHAGMQCVVIHDAFTAYQDFGGASLVSDSLDAVTVKEILKLLKMA